jgi:hypothetical protein
MVILEKAEIFIHGCIDIVQQKTRFCWSFVHEQKSSVGQTAVVFEHGFGAFRRQTAPTP